MRKHLLVKNITLKNITLGLALCLTLGQQAAKATSTLPNVEPEIVASTWDSDDAHYACVTINGKELLRFKENNSKSDTAVEEKAEEIAAKLDQLVKNKMFYAEKLYPIKTKDGIALRIDGTDLLKLSARDLANSTTVTVINGTETYNKALASAAIKQDSRLSGSVEVTLDMGLKVANTLRIAFGAKALPASFLKLAESTARHSLDNIATIAKASGHFSGNASWYGPHFHGHKTSDGTIFDQEGLTAAHRSLPFGTKLLVMNRKTGDTCVVKVNDRGPFVDGRIIDLSKGAARQLNMLGSGVAMVDCIVLK